MGQREARPRVTDVAGIGDGTETDRLLTPAAYRTKVREWLAAQRDDLRSIRRSQTDELSGDRQLVASLWEAGLSKSGWPTSVGGLGWSVRHRAILYDECARAHLGVPQWFMPLEVCGPAVLRFAPHLADAVRRALEGEDTWCQGFSEPDAGSDLPALRTRATQDGSLWRIDGEKIWISMGHCATHCFLLTRTGPQAERTRGLTVLLVPLQQVASQRVIDGLSGRDELGQLLFNGGTVGVDAVVGEVGKGWEVVLYLLQWERGMYAWQRHCWLLQQFERFCARYPQFVEARAADVGEIGVALYALRKRCLENLGRLENDEFIGPEASVEKVLLAQAETGLFDLVREAVPVGAPTGDDSWAAEMQADYFYSRMATVYGGSEEIQLDTIGERLLGLPRDPARSAVRPPSV